MRRVSADDLSKRMQGGKASMKPDALRRAGRKGKKKLRFIDLSRGAATTADTLAKRLLYHVNLYLETSFHEGKCIAPHERIKTFKRDTVGEILERIKGMADPSDILFLETMDITVMANIGELRSIVKAYGHIINTSELQEGRVRVEVDGLPYVADEGGTVGRGIRVAHVTSEVVTFEWNESDYTGIVALVPGEQEEWANKQRLRLVEIKKEESQPDIRNPESS